MKQNLTTQEYTLVERNGQLKMTLNTEIIIPKEAPVRLTDAQLEELDYRNLYRAFSSKGRNPVTDPRVLFKVLAYANQMHIYSNRQIEDACRNRIDMIRLRYATELEIRKARLIVLNADYAKSMDNLQVLKGEVVNAIKGESSFSPEMLSGLIVEAEKECTRLAALCAQAEKDVTDSEQLLKEVAACYDTLVSWAELYETASLEKKKMIVNCFINRVDVYRGCKLHINFNFDDRQFVEGLDCIEAA